MDRMGIYQCGIGIMVSQLWLYLSTGNRRIGLASSEVQLGDLRFVRFILVSSEGVVSDICVASPVKLWYMEQQYTAEYFMVYICIHLSYIPYRIFNNHVSVLLSLRCFWNHSKMWLTFVFIRARLVQPTNYRTGIIISPIQSKMTPADRYEKVSIWPQDIDLKP